jgi:vanillate O-demethylase ferredoxin subunit
MTDDSMRPVTVAKRTDEAYNMVSFELVDPTGAELPAFSAGSHIDVGMPNGLVRQYSLLNSQSERHRYVIGVWKNPNGRGGSRAMHEDVAEGATLTVSLPRNRFRVPKGTKRAVLLARGIGITPILSIADYLSRQSIPFELHYLPALMSSELFVARIAGAPYAAQATIYSEKTEDGRLLNAKTLLGQVDEDAQIFICGIDWWQDPIIETAKKAGWPEERIHVERFTAKVPDAILDTVFDVKIASTGAVYKIPGDKSVTAALEEAGVKVPTSCEQGMCGTCQIKVLEGEVDHRDKRLSPEQREAGLFLACVSRAKGNLLVLDL